MKFNANTLFYGDNFEILKNHIPNESIDLIYLDPPFNSKANYNILFKESTGEQSSAQIQAFSDFWEWNEEANKAYKFLSELCLNEIVLKYIRSLNDFLGKSDLFAYIVMMGTRLFQLERVLKPTGSIFLHCDPTASHYLKILMDCIFGIQNFRNEIIWRRTGSHNKIRRFAPIHDVILFYTKSEKYKWNYPKKRYMKGHIEENFLKDDLGYKTNYYGNVLTGSGIRHGDSGKPWRGFNPTVKNRHWAIPKAVLEDIDEDLSNLNTQQKLDRLFDLGFIKITPGSVWPIYERRIKSSDGQSLNDIWAFQPYTNGTVFGIDEGIDEDVRWLSPKDRERLGYPTQKPIGLLERIIRSCTNENDLILDPFCGCGTAIITAEKLHRRWIGIDITWLAINLVKGRMQTMFPDSKFNVEGEPKDMGAAKELAKTNRYQFQWWALSLINAVPTGATSMNPRKGKKGVDEGIDGLLRFTEGAEGRIERIVIQVKSGHVGVRDIREFRDVITRNNATMGLFITLGKPSKEMEKETITTKPYKSPTWKIEYPRIQILTIEDLLRRIKPTIPPTINVFEEAVLSSRMSNQKQQTLFAD